MFHDRYSLPIGATYYTVQLGLWQPGVGSPVAEKRLACQKRMVDEQIKEMNQLIGSYISVPHYEMQIPDLRSNWNCWVKFSAQSLMRFDFVKTSDSLVKKITALMESNEVKTSEPSSSKS